MHPTFRAIVGREEDDVVATFPALSCAAAVLVGTFCPGGHVRRGCG